MIGTPLSARTFFASQFTLMIATASALREESAALFPFALRLSLQRFRESLRSRDTSCLSCDSARTLPCIDQAALRQHALRQLSSRLPPYESVRANRRSPASSRMARFSSRRFHAAHDSAICCASTERDRLAASCHPQAIRAASIVPEAHPARFLQLPRASARSIPKP